MQHIEKPLRVYVYSYDFEYVYRLLRRLWLNLICPALYERSCSFQIVIGVARGYWDVSLGNYDPCLPGFQHLTTFIISFGLLHRIPQPPEDREPGTVPPELSEGAEDFEEQQLFVPAEVPQPVPVLEDDHYQEWDQSFHSVHPEHSHYDEHSDPLKSSFYGNGHHGHTVYIHDHDRDHDHHDHGHDYEHEEYEYESSESASPQVTAMPLRLPFNAPTSHPNSNTHLGFGIPRNMTPTQARPLSGLRNSSGTYTNGDSRP